MIRFATLTAIMAVTLTCTANYSYGQLFQRFRGNDRCCRQPVFQSRACQPMCCQPVRQNCCMSTAVQMNNAAPGCGCGQISVINTPSDPGNPGDPVQQDPGIGQKQDCADQYVACIATCNACTGAQKEECLAYRAMPKSRMQWHGCWPLPSARVWWRYCRLRNQPGLRFPIVRRGELKRTVLGGSILGPCFFTAHKLDGYLRQRSKVKRFSVRCPICEWSNSKDRKSQRPEVLQSTLYRRGIACLRKRSWPDRNNSSLDPATQHS